MQKLISLRGTWKPWWRMLPYVLRQSLKVVRISFLPSLDGFLDLPVFRFGLSWSLGLDIHSGTWEELHCRPQKHKTRACEQNSSSSTEGAPILTNILVPDSRYSESILYLHIYLNIMFAISLYCQKNITNIPDQIKEIRSGKAELGLRSAGSSSCLARSGGKLRGPVDN